MCIDGHLVLCCCLQHLAVVIDHPLPMVVFAIGNDLAHIARLHRMHAVTLHQLVGRLQLLLIRSGSSGSLMMHDDLDALAERTRASIVVLGIG